MQPGHEEVALASEDETELMDKPSSFAHEMTVRQKQENRIMCKILFMFLFPNSAKKLCLKEILGQTPKIYPSRCRKIL